MKRVTTVLAIAAMGVGFPIAAAASHKDSDGVNRDFVVGTGSNEFLFVIGDARLHVRAHSDPLGADPGGFVRNEGDPDGAGLPIEPFAVGGEVTCLRVDGNRAAIKYRFERAEGSAEPFEGGGVQLFVEDNGPPQGGEAVDATAFDPPQPAGIFDLDANRCDDPNLRLYDQITAGNFRVHDAAP